MNILAALVLLVWPAIVAALFTFFRPGRAAMIAYVVGWMYLPLTTLGMPGLPDYGKFTATSLALIPLIVFWDAKTIFAWRPSSLDLPMFVWLMSPIPTSLSNGLGLYDGVSGSITSVLTYGIPYFVGRLYLRTAAEWAFLTKTILIASLCYVPLCLYEIRMSPNLHDIAYGFSGRTGFKTRSGFGPFRWIPVVFMNSAFELNMLMGISALLSFWSWRTRSPQSVLGVNPIWFCLVFTVVSVLCRKMSGIGLMVTGFGILFCSTSSRALGNLFAWTALLIPILYIALFVSGMWRGDGISAAVSKLSQERAVSLQFRLENDKLLVEKALQRPLLGWGSWGRNRVYNDKGEDISITDSMWTLQLGMRGLVGLAALTMIYALPAAIFLFLVSRRPWTDPSVAAVAPFALILIVHLMDNMFNAFANVIYPMLSGGVGTYCLILLTRGRNPAALKHATSPTFRSFGNKLQIHTE